MSRRPSELPSCSRTQDIEQPTSPSRRFREKKQPKQRLLPSCSDRALPSSHRLDSHGHLPGVPRPVRVRNSRAVGQRRSTDSHALRVAASLPLSPLLESTYRYDRIGQDSVRVETRSVLSFQKAESSVTPINFRGAVSQLTPHEAGEPVKTWTHRGTKMDNDGQDRTAS